MQLSFKTVAAAVALALGSTSALAVESTTSGNSSLFVTVFDSVLGASVVQDLGLNYSDFLESLVTPDAGLTLNFTVDMSVFTQVGSNPDNIRWSVFAGDGTGAFGATEALVTAGLGLGTIPGTNGNIVGILGSNGAAAVYQQWNTDAACGAAAVTCTGTEFSSTYFGEFGEDYRNNLLVMGSTGLNDALGFYSLRRSSPGALDPLTSSQYANSTGVATWMLSSTGALTYVAPVPLPAALWLLLSGLAGVGVVGRRKAAV